MCQKEHKIFRSVYALFFAVILILTSVCTGCALKDSKTEIAASENLVLADIETEHEKNKASEEEELKRLKDELIDVMKSSHPSIELSFAIKNLDTGALLVHNNKKMNSASIIKLFILETVYNEIAKGNYTLSGEREKELEKMITESDNKATNSFIDDFGGQNENRKVDETNLINKHIRYREYAHTELNRKMYDVTPPEGPSGYQNYTSVLDVCEFLEGIYSKELLEEPYNTYTLNLLKNQKRRTKIPAKITEKYPEICVANKTGELSRVENDAAIIMGDDFNIIFVVLTDNIPLKPDGSTDYDLKKEVQKTISDMGLMVADFYVVNEF